jgi:hypothetical protein
MLGKDTKTEEPENTVPAFDFSGGNITLDSESRRAGGTYVFIGSYGFYIRGDSVRVAKRNDDAFAEVAPRVEPGYIPVRYAVRRGYRHERENKKRLDDDAYVVSR